MNLEEGMDAIAFCSGRPTNMESKQNHSFGLFSIMSTVGAWNYQVNVPRLTDRCDFVSTKCLMQNHLDSCECHKLLKKPLFDPDKLFFITVPNMAVVWFHNFFVSDC